MIIALNKPYGVLSQFNGNPDYPDQRTLAELDLPPDFRPVGRLDMDSEGLLLLTDEVDVEARLLDPARGHERAYYVQVDGEPDAGDLEQWRMGVEIRGYRTRRCFVELLDEAPKLEGREPPVDRAAAERSRWLKMVLREGKNRQVRRMTAKLGYPTLRLYRASIGRLVVDDLAVGGWRFLSQSECDLVWQSR